MLVKEWMTEDPITIDENASIMKAVQIMKEHSMRRLPVVKAGKLVGIITDRDIREATPSRATTLDIHELYYLLSEIRVKDVMTPNPIAISPDVTVEYAAVVMLENCISGLPIVDEENHVLGIITQTDIFKVLIHITGIYYGPWQVAFLLPAKPGLISELVQNIRTWGARIVTVLSAYEGLELERRRVYIRLTGIEEEKFKEMIEALKEKYEVLYWVRDDLSYIPRKEERSKSREASKFL
ncbi:CBS domain containing protein [Thermodesulfatator indicus DSM 15286]|uniref:CBS domain containing protein n=1 Tax=Thermodesulfatator indicus (strain DSM 15286 / JCM 11887 / CIR29812) TaxID=667014 RepID=F8ACE1_THEID|nr:CBS and ACT domain-containing protein [Thermodesulfatator indicus]AEH44642.1 CBS domain containing protein [Thermodesulfatator indicus DSM 15286]